MIWGEKNWPSSTQTKPRGGGGGGEHNVLPENTQPNSGGSEGGGLPIGPWEK